jgi:hypothetical protein
MTMRTKNMMRHLAWGVLGLVTQQAFSQASIPNNGGGVSAFLGWNAVANQILEVKNDANQPIEWYTNAMRRMLLHPTLTGQTVNGYTPVDLSGNLGIGLFNATTGSAPITRPLTLLHLDNGATEDAGFRDWMRTGVTMSHLSDLMYVGLKVDTGDISSATITWSDNFEGGTAGPDRLRFNWTSTVSLEKDPAPHAM